MSSSCAAIHNLVTYIMMYVAYVVIWLVQLLKNIVKHIRNDVISNSFSKKAFVTLDEEGKPRLDVQYDYTGMWNFLLVICYICRWHAPSIESTIPDVPNWTYGVLVFYYSKYDEFFTFISKNTSNTASYYDVNFFQSWIETQSRSSVGSIVLVNNDVNVTELYYHTLTDTPLTVNEIVTVWELLDQLPREHGGGPHNKLWLFDAAHGFERTLEGDEVVV